MGRHTLLWGETLFFGGNGIAGGQAPLDLVKLLSVPNSQFKEVARPTGKLSGQMQLTDALSLGAYVGYEWEKTRLMPVGAYLSTGDTLGPGAERTNAGPPVGTFIKAPDLDARDSGQWGLQLRWNAEDIEHRFRLLRHQLSRHWSQQQLQHGSVSRRQPAPAQPSATAGRITRTSAPTA